MFDLQQNLSMPRQSCAGNPHAPLPRRHIWRKPPNIHASMATWPVARGNKNFPGLPTGEILFFMEWLRFY